MKKILITAGPTNEYIDEVMKITNMSTGRLGVELTKNYLNNGDLVTLIATRSVIRGGLFERYGLSSNPNLKIVPIETTDDMYKALEEEKDADKERIDYLNGLNILLQSAIKDLKHDLGIA